MRLTYICAQCGSPIDQIHVQSLDEAAFGFDCLTEAEKNELLSFDPVRNNLTVKSLCDRCIEEMRLEPMDTMGKARHWVH